MPKTWMLLIMLVAATMAVSGFTAFPAQAQVTAGSINSVSFPSDFPTARQSIPPYVGYPYYLYSSQSGTPYLLEGNPAPVILRFYNGYNYSGTGMGNITLTASSDAFVADVSSTMYINQVGVTFTFTLTPIIKSGLDGTYSVNYTATNELSNQVAQQSGSITVWSTVHGEASDSLYTASMMLSYYSGGLISIGTRYQTAGGEANMTLASYEYAQATLAFNNKDWNGTRTHAQNTTDLINKADTAEAAASLPDRTAYLVQIGTYPLLIIAVLVMIYIAAATFRKIYPSTKPARTT
jgi:hypothetical protein